jgi:C_GCAxxG_C_C family probable redox protein
MDPDTSPENRLDVLAQNARDTLALSGNCAQTSFAVLQQEFGLEGGTILKALTPFPGIALRGETCGAVVGCLMAIGLVYGRDDLDDWKGFVASLGRSRRFCRQFEEQHGSTSCANLLEAKLGRRFNLADRGESAEYVAAGGPQACGETIASAVQIAAEIITRKNQPG